MPCCSKKGCGHTFDEIFLSSMLPAAARAVVRKHVRRVLMDQARSQFPMVLWRLRRQGSVHMQPVKKELPAPRAQVVEVQRLRAQYEHALREYEDLQAYPVDQGHQLGSQRLLVEACRQEWAQAKKNLYQAKRYVYSDYRGQPLTEEQYLEALELGSGFELGTETALVFPCGAGAVPCRGMLDANWQCVLCGHRRCASCHAYLKTRSLNTLDTSSHAHSPGSLGPASHAHSSGSLGTSSHTHLSEELHICQPEELATARLVMADSQACPGCGTRISRVQGCDHMWCPGCKTGFNYQTGAVISGRNTNPHYQQWLRERGRSPVPGLECEIAYPEVDFLAGDLRTLGLTEAEAQLGCRLAQLVRPTQPYFEGSDLRSGTDTQPQLLEKYLLGLLTDKQLEDGLFRHYRQRERHAHHQALLETLQVVGVELLQRLLAFETPEALRAVLVEIESFRVYLNQCFVAVNRGLGYDSHPFISPQLEYLPSSKMGKS